MKRVFIVFAMMLIIVSCTGCTGSEQKQTNDEEISESIITTIASSQVVLKTETEKLLDQKMIEVINNKKTWREERAKIYAKTTKYGAVWSPDWNNKDLELSTKESNTTMLCLGFKETAPKNSLYIGPVLFWWKDRPSGEIYKEIIFVVKVFGEKDPWRERPYEYGFKTCSEPPEEIIKVLLEYGIEFTPY